MVQKGVNHVNVKIVGGEKKLTYKNCLKTPKSVLLLYPHLMITANTNLVES